MLNKRDITFATIVHEIVSLRNLFPHLEIDIRQHTLDYIEEHEDWNQSYNSTAQRAKNYLATEIENLFKKVEQGGDVDELLTEKLRGYRKRQPKPIRIRQKIPQIKNGIEECANTQQSLQDTPERPGKSGTLHYSQSNRPGKAPRAFLIRSVQGNKPC